MRIWNRAPILRLLMPFATSILLAINIPTKQNNGLIILIFLSFITLLWLTFFNTSRNSYSFSWGYGLVINVLLISIGYQFTLTKTDTYSSEHFSNYLKNVTYVHIRIDAAIVEKEKSIKAIVETLSMDSISVSGKALMYFEKDEHSLKLNYGDELIVKNKFKEIPLPKNPGEFDFKKFMAHKYIYQQAYLKTNEWVYTGKNSGNAFIAYSITVRNRLLSIFKQAKLKGDEYAVASALLVGYTDKLDADLLSAYSQTGALHVLSVSGLHVGIVFMVLNTLLLFMDKLKYGLSLKTCLLIFFLWFYAFISGLSPSVMRSAAMLSFVVYEKSFKKNSTIYNTLAASAFFLLLCDPNYILDVGFQLSYLAVFGIVCIQPFFSSLITTNNWLFTQCVSLITVSIAAQLATFPISIYYFHQFPNYFLLTNMVAIPLSTCIIYLGIALIIFSGNSFLVNYLSVIFSASVHLLNSIIKWISQLPYATINGVFINIYQLLIMYVSLIFCVIFFYKKRIGYLKLFLLSIIALLVIQLVMEVQSQHQRKFIVYAIPKITAIDFIYNRAHLLIADSVNGQATSPALNQLQSYWMQLKLNSLLNASVRTRTSAVFIQDETIQFYDKRIVVLKNEKKTEQLYKMGSSLDIDYAILSCNVKLSIEKIRAVYHPHCIVFDSSNTPKQIKLWKSMCITQHQTYYSVLDTGAFIIEF